MAMHLNGISPIIIKKQGRWSSNTFLNCIHEQIGAFTAGVASRMSEFIPYFNTEHSIHPQIADPIDFLQTPN